MRTSAFAEWSKDCIFIYLVLDLFLLINFGCDFDADLVLDRMNG
jgi:hypothetical protein